MPAHVFCVHRMQALASQAIGQIDEHSVAASISANGKFARATAERGEGRSSATSGSPHDGMVGPASWALLLAGVTRRVRDLPPVPGTPPPPVPRGDPADGRHAARHRPAGQFAVRLPAQAARRPAPVTPPPTIPEVPLPLPASAGCPRTGPSRASRSPPTCAPRPRRPQRTGTATSGRGAMLANDQWGDCVFAGNGHIVEQQTALGEG